MFTSEVTSPRIRTTVHCVAGVVVTTGTLIPVVMSTMGLHWRTVCIISSVTPILGLIHIYTIPESPHWLVMKNKLKEALQSLMKLRGSDYDCVRERDYLEKSYCQKHNDDDSSCTSFFNRLQDPDIWKPFIIVNIMFILQIFSGKTQVQY